MTEPTLFRQYRRTQIAEMADWHPGFDMTDVSVSAPDAKAGSPKEGDKIARNPANHADQWLVAAEYFAANFEPLGTPQEARTEPAEREPDDAHYGENCPVGMVQVEFVGCSPQLRRGEYGWKPTESAFLELWVDGERFRIDVGNVIGKHGESRRGLNIIGPLRMVVDHHSVNAVNLAIPERAPTQEAGTDG